MKISVIIPVYNAERFIYTCLDSVIEQTYKDWEIVAINDGSLDNSYSILLDYSMKDDRIKVFTQENQGAGHTRNEAIRKICGDYIVFLDADDFLEPNFFKDLVGKLSENPDVIFIDVLREKPNGELIRVEKMSDFKNHSKDSLIRCQMTGKMPWGGCRKVVKTSLIKDNHIAYTKDTVGEEALYSFKVLQYANKIIFLDKPYYHYVSYPQSLSTKGEDDPWGGVCINIKKYLVKNGMYETYENTLNSFGLTALVVSIYRKVQIFGFFEAIKESKIAIKNYKSNYSFNLDLDSIENRVKVILPFIRTNFVFPIVLIAKLKAHLSS